MSASYGRNCLIESTPGQPAGVQQPDRQDGVEAGRGGDPLRRAGLGAGLDHARGRGHLRSEESQVRTAIFLFLVR
jgi:hypothetical protein